jgi:integrase
VPRTGVGPHHEDLQLPGPAPPAQFQEAAAIPPVQFQEAAAIPQPHPAAEQPLPDPQALMGGLHEAPDSWYRDCDLPKRAARLLWWGLSSGTRRTYQTPRNNYVRFCAMEGILRPFPATPYYLCLWVDSMAAQRPELQAKTISAYLVGLRSLHIDLGFSTDHFDDNPRLDRMVRGVKRSRAEPREKPRLSITRPLLLDILALLNRHEPNDMTLYAAFCLAYAGFLRIGEFTWPEASMTHGTAEFARWHITRRSVQIIGDNEHMHLTLPSSKTDYYREGVTITIAAAGDAACPVTAIIDLFNLCPGYGNNVPLFARWPEDHHWGARGAFTREYVTSNLRRLLTRAGINAENYSGHSFRKGAATDARAAGLTENDIKTLGRWKSHAWKVYVTQHPEYRLQVAQRFRNGPPVPQILELPEEPEDADLPL